MTINPEQAPETIQKNSAEDNLVKMRKALELANAAREAAEQKAAQYEQERIANANKRFRDDEEEPVDEPYVDRKALDRKFAKFEETFEKKVDVMAEKKARTLLEQERQNSFLKQNPDFQQILSPELIEKFAKDHPELAEPMLDMPDNFSRQKLLYQNIKALGLHRPAAPQQSIQQTIDKNRKSPYYQPSGGNTPPYASDGDFSEGGKKNAYNKMQELIRNRRG